MDAWDQDAAAGIGGEPGTPAAEYAEKKKQVTSWLGKIEQARTFDEAIRKGYARDRRYARGDTGFEVEVNLIGSFIDTLIGFIYAKDPDVDCSPSQQVQAPRETPPPQPQLTMNPDADAMALMQWQSEMQQFMAQAQARKQRRIERDLFAQTLEVVISKLWRRARLKRQCRRQVRSVMTTSIGWLKVSWQERSQMDPLTSQRITDLKGQIARVGALKAELAEDGEAASDYESKIATLEDEMKSLADAAQVVIERGLAIDFVASENMQVAPGVEMMEYRNAAWIGERIFMRIEDAAAAFPDVPLEKLRKATRYAQVKPRPVQRGLDSTMVLPETDVSATEADQFTQADAIQPSGMGGQPAGKSDTDFISVWEVWDWDSGVVRVTAEGLDCWLREPAVPNIKSPRFYPYFALAFIEVDGERSPQSMVQRSWTLQNEYSRTRSNFAEHRRRSMPGVLFDETEIDPKEAKKLAAGKIQELTGIRTVSGKDLNACFGPKPVSGIDPILYDTNPVRRDMEDIWGVQQALQGSVNVEKTATEAEIQQGGFQSRTGAMRDALEDMLTELAMYTAEVAVQSLEPEDVLKMAGPDAVWPQLESPDELAELMDVSIRAGSTGKPNTRADREAWAAVMPLLQAMIPTVGQMRQAQPSEIADSLESLVDETLRRAGDSLDVTKFLPQTEGMNMAFDPMAAVMGMNGGEGMPAIGGEGAGSMAPPQPANMGGGITPGNGGRPDEPI